MSTKSREEKLPGRRVRRSFTEEFRRDAVAMVEREGLTAAEVSRRLGVNVNLLRKWREKSGKGIDVSATDVETELRQLREENRRLRMEREILKKAAAFFANEKN
jgi:transposase